jgi:hypothetical protein
MFLIIVLAVGVNLLLARRREHHVGGQARRTALLAGVPEVTSR